MEKEVSRRSFLKIAGLGALIIAVTPKVLGAINYSAEVNYSALDLFGGKERVIQKRIDYARRNLEGASERQLDFAEMVSGNYPGEPSRSLAKAERIEKIISYGLEENYLATLLGIWHPISHLKILGNPDFKDP